MIGRRNNPSQKGKAGKQQRRLRTSKTDPGKQRCCDPRAAIADDAADAHIDPVGNHAEQRADKQCRYKVQKGHKTDKAGRIRQHPCQPSDNNPLRPKAVKGDVEAEDIASERRGLQSNNIHAAITPQLSSKDEARRGWPAPSSGKMQCHRAAKILLIVDYLTYE